MKEKCTNYEVDELSGSWRSVPYSKKIGLVTNGWLQDHYIFYEITLKYAMHANSLEWRLVILKCLNMA